MIFNSVDSDIMQSLHDNSFPLPDLSNRLYIIRKTIVSNGKVIAIGLVKLSAEGILITNQELPLITRARVIPALIESLKSEAKSYGLDECHAFVKDDCVSKLLIHLGFKPSKSKQTLVIQF